MVENQPLQHATFNRDHSRALFYGLNFPNDPPPGDWLKKDLGPKGEYPDTYTLQQLLDKSTTPEAITLILDVMSQELGNVSMEGGYIDYLAEYLLTQAQTLATREDLEALYEIANALDIMLVKATSEINVILTYVQTVELWDQFSPLPDAPILTPKGRHWIKSIRESAALVAKELGVKLPKASQDMAAAAKIMDEKNALFPPKEEPKTGSEASSEAGSEPSSTPDSPQE